MDQEREGKLARKGDQFSDSSLLCGDSGSSNNNAAGEMQHEDLSSNPQNTHWKLPVRLWCATQWKGAS